MQNKKNQHRESLLVKVLILFYFYTATAVHEAGALAPANGHGRILRAYPIPYFSSLPPNSFSAAPAAPIIPLTVGFFRAPATIFT